MNVCHNNTTLTVNITCLCYLNNSIFSSNIDMLLTSVSRVNKYKLCIYLDHMLQLLLDLLTIALRKIFLLLPIGGFGVACSE